MQDANQIYDTMDNVNGSENIGGSWRHKIGSIVAVVFMHFVSNFQCKTFRFSSIYSMLLFILCYCSII